MTTSMSQRHKAGTSSRCFPHGTLRLSACARGRYARSDRRTENDPARPSACRSRLLVGMLDGLFLGQVLDFLAQCSATAHEIAASLEACCAFWARRSFSARGVASCFDSCCFSWARRSASALAVVAGASGAPMTSAAIAVTTRTVFGIGMTDPVEEVMPRRWPTIALEFGSSASYSRR
jgi:hypothetical protein